ncbi:MAG: response regulator [Deltaproteobacteria bacterium]|nr:response regulator [Deltaproteobacteria bacterium]
MDRRVLLVDADPGALRTLNQSLDRDWIVTTAAGVSQARILLDAFEYRALITSHGTSSQAGIQLLEWVRARHPKVQRLLATDCEPATLAAHLLSGLIQHFVAKPIDSTALRDALGDPAT